MNRLLVDTTFLLGILVYSNEVSAFVLQPLIPDGMSCSVASSSTAIFLAKKQQNKKKKVPSGASSGGGFGKGMAKTATSEAKKVDDDYAMFPALEPRVTETIVPTPQSMVEEIESTGALPIEIYDRLDQIYGFPDFNYEKASVEEESETTDDDGETFSLEDLLAAPTSPSVSETIGKTTKSSGDTLDLNELLAAATGGPAESLSNKGSTPIVTDDADDSEKAANAIEMKNAISSLPPFEKINVLHLDPLVLTIDDFFTEEECDRYVKMSLEPAKKGHEKTIDSFKTRSKTVGKDANAKSQRTSTTWFHHYKSVPELMAKASRLVGLETIDRWEEPQTVQYKRSEKFSWHLDALAPPQATDDLGGQRLATLLVYLKDLESGGATIFRDLSPAKGESDGDAPNFLKVQPKKGSALMFFPSAGGIPNAPFDIRTLHCGEVVAESSESDKWISQLWLRASPYSPTAPPGNLHQDALGSVKEYCAASE
mmetsp:Transcript_22407/g.52884  ORF Transcript_22407/g.52884 Transcript_22407/m.52884 type:complete len:483 (+) Transcript_22407:144-1592(+)